MVSGHIITLTCLPLTFLPSAESRGLFNLVSRGAYTAASAIASALTAETPADENEPPLLSLPSSNGLSSTDSTSSSQVGDLDDEYTNSSGPLRVCFAILYQPFVLTVFIQRRNIIVAGSVNL